ncbi:hypothetical protein BRADI_4g25035v3 [Brachypodium distachyon]|uniref:Uncharacterized protein n=1 Tax=Brachypodium distachyon TaxID=15368 RepID=A0A2K2CQ30_BRADI|nr:hypothetical protein BRADI_4g25035v3 [Brachypodium distachyon]
MHGVKRQSYLATDGRIKELKQKDLKRRVHVHVSQASVQGQQAAARAKIQLSTTDIFKRFQDGIHAWELGMLNCSSPRE